MRGLVLVCCCGCFAGSVEAFAAPLTLVRDGKTDFTIVLPASASKTDRFAAEELRNHLKESTGADFPVKDEPFAGSKTIQLGTHRAREIAIAAFPNSRPVTETSYAVRSGETLAICGKGRTGNAYGVYLFLERALGCRWFTPTGVNLVPKHPTLSLDKLAEAETPRLPYRSLIGGNQSRAGRTDGADYLFYFRNRMNMTESDYAHPADPALKGALAPRIKMLYPSVHSFFIYIPVEKYFKDHPDWFSLDAKGKRVKDRHLCFSNPGLRAEMTKNVIAHAKEKGGEGFLDLSQWDAGGEMCACEGCRAAAKKYGTPAGRFFEYLHEISGPLKKECPGIVLHTLAYHRDCTQIPPTGLKRYPDNIAVVFAPIDDDQFKSVAAPSNAESLQDFRGWAKIANVWLWDYPTLYYQPFGSLGRMADSIRTYANEGLVGGFIEHDWHTNWGGDFADLLTWCMLQLYRNPDADWRRLRDEFCRGVYGAAADKVIAYEEELESRREGLKSRVGAFGRSDVVIAPEDLVRWQGDFERMERAVDADADAIQRLREVRLTLDNLTLVKWAKVRRLHPEGSPDDVYIRATNSFEVALLNRYQRPSMLFLRDRARSEAFRKSFDAAYELSKADLKPLPDYFSRFPEEQVVQVFPKTSGYPGHIIRVDDPDAALGWALKEVNMKPEWMKYPVTAGAYDQTYKYCSPTLEIGEKEAVIGKYHLYHVGKCKIPSSECLVWVGTSWHLHAYCGECFHPGVNEEWDLWVSAKIEGPAYDKASTLKESALYLDRLVLVGPTPCK